MNVGISDCIYILYYSTPAQASKSALQYSMTALVATIFTLKTHILLLLYYTKWYITLVLFSFAFQLATY